MSPRVAGDRPLPAGATEVLSGIYQHRLLSTTQLHALYTPHATPRWMRRVIGLLASRGLVDRTQGPGSLSLWFLTEYGAETVETAGPRAETRRRLVGPAQAEGPLRKHTLRVNDVGIAFVRAARERGDECGPESWRHEIAHPISLARGRRPPDMAIADALLTYLQTGEDGSLALHQRWIELDRGTARPAEHLASKISAYTRLRYFTPPGGSTDQPAELWRSYYRSWPHLLIVLADQSRERMRLRIQRTLVLHRSDPANLEGAAIPLAFVALEDLLRQGPFAAIFTAAEHPTQPVDWLGQPQPKDR
ncbi:MAG: replication-relaxation family protein [Solirubrobacteraceae bacterium]